MRLRTLLVCIVLGAMLGVGLVTQSVRQEPPVAEPSSKTVPGEGAPERLIAWAETGLPEPARSAETPLAGKPAAASEGAHGDSPETSGGPLAEDHTVQASAEPREPQPGLEVPTRQPVLRIPQAAEPNRAEPEPSPVQATLPVGPPVAQSAAAARQPQPSAAAPEGVEPPSAGQDAPPMPSPAAETGTGPSSDAAAEAPPSKAVRSSITNSPDRPPSQPGAAQANQVHLLVPDQQAAQPEAASRQPEQPSSGRQSDKAESAAGPSSLVVQPVGEGDRHLEVFVYDRDVREVLALLSRQGGWNILPTRSVQGKVSLALSNVDLETALAALLRATGYVARREGNVIYVGTPEDFSKYSQSLDVIATRVYRPSYVSATELEQLLTPLLTPQVGKIKASTAPAKGIAADGNAAGGNDLATGDVLVVQDYESVLRRMDQIVREVDRRPAQVAIEAMILSVELDDENKFGVDFELLRNKAHLRLVVSDPLASLGDLQPEDGMLNIAFLDSSIGAFLEALETIGDTNVIATPRLLVLNKQRAEILIGAQLGYVNTTVTETSATQSVDFLEVGTQLRLRPFIAHDRTIRLEIHPELSTGNVRVEQGITLPDKEVTSVTTNVLVEDGRTVVIGGLMREELVNNTTQVPFLGSLPVVGVLFQERTEKTKRREILVLVTPRIVNQPFLDHEGDSMAAEFHRRQQVYADKMMPWGKRYLGRKHYRLAQEAWARGDRERAMRHANLAVHFDPMNRAAIDLRSDIANGRHDGPHSLPRLWQGAPQPAPVHPQPEPVPPGRNASRPVLQRSRRR